MHIGAGGAVSAKLVGSVALATLVGAGALWWWNKDPVETLDGKELAEVRCELSSEPETESRYRLAFERDDLTYPYAISVHDYDGDGRPDLMAANADTSAMHLFSNKGGLSFVERVISLGDVKVVESHVWVDIDADSREDLVFIDNLRGSIHWLDAKERVHDIAPPGAFPRAYNVAAGDFDNDGRPDIASSNFIGGELRVFTNPGATGKSWASELVDNPGADVRGIAAGDIDGDGDIDLVAAARLSNSLFWYENEDGEWRRYTISTSIHLPTRAHLVDLDNDGDLDVLVASGFFSTEERDSVVRCAAGVIWFENHDAKGAWARRQIRVPFVSGFNAAAGDLNGDGILDVSGIAYGLEGRLVWFEGPGDLRGTWIMHSVNDRLPFGVDVKIADLDGDNRPEIIASSIRGRKIRSGKLQVWTLH